MSVQCPSCQEWAPARLVEKRPDGAWECAYCRPEPAQRHTPGPWVASESTAYGTAAYQRRWTVTAADPGASPGSGYKVQVVSILGDAPRGMADAALISAAPELAHVLRQHLDWYEDRWAPRDEAEERELIERTREALRKAGVLA